MIVLACELTYVLSSTPTSDSVADERRRNERLRFHGWSCETEKRANSQTNRLLVASSLGLSLQPASSSVLSSRALFTCADAMVASSLGYGTVTRRSVIRTPSSPSADKSIVAVVKLLLSVACLRFIGFGGVAVAAAAGAGPPASSSLSSSAAGSGSGCPKACFCNALSQIVYCSRRGLTSMPESIPAGTLQLNLNGNAFQSGVVGRVNMSHYTGLQHLYMSECGLEQLHVDTFIDLVELRWLDLSNNRLKVGFRLAFLSEFVRSAS